MSYVEKAIIGFIGLLKKNKQINHVMVGHDILNYVG